MCWFLHRSDCPTPLHAPKGTRFEHAPVNLNFRSCQQTLTDADAVIVDSVRDPITLLALEAVYIKRRKPTINTKDEIKSHTLQYAF